MPPDTELLVGVIADFENGEDLDTGNPFDVDHADSYARIVQAFVTGCTVPDTLAALKVELPGLSVENTAVTVAMAALFQGMAIGYDYAVRSGVTT
jgi:hypothetical protein